MEHIQDKRKLLEEMKFRQREIRSHLENSIKSLHTSLSEYGDLGILNEEQMKFLKSLSVDNIDNMSFEDFQDILEKASEIKAQIEKDSEELLKKIEELEKGVK
mgnify:CR=1 FL=1